MRHEAGKPRWSMPEIKWSKLVVPLLLILGIGLVAGMPYIQENFLREKGCPGHWHATFRVFDEDEELRFQHPRFDMASMSMRTHLHQPDDAKMHLEGGCADMGDFFGAMGMRLRGDSLRLDDELHEGRSIANEGNLTWRFFVTDETGNWTERPDLPSYQAKDGQRILLTYGDLGDEAIAAQQERVPRP